MSFTGKTERTLRPSLILALTVSTLFFVPIHSAVGEDIALDRVTLQLKWKHSFQFAGYYAAKWKGYYQEEGLDVTFAEASPTNDPVETVVEGKAQYGVMASGLLYQRLHGKPVVVLACIFQHSPYIILTRKDSGISSPYGLVGRKVVKSSLRTFTELDAMLFREGIPIDSITFIEHTSGISDLIEKRVDAISAYITKEPYLMQEAGVEPYIIRPIDYGVDFYGDSLFTSEKELRRHPGRVSAFRRASLRGWEYAMGHVREMAEVIAAMPEVSERGLTTKHLLYEAEQMAELIHPELVEPGHVNPGRWERIAETYVKLGMADPGYSLDGFIYNDHHHSLRDMAHILSGIVAGIMIVGVFAWMWTRQLRSAVARGTSQLRQSQNALRDSVALSNQLRALLVDLNRCNSLDEMLPPLLDAAIETTGMEGGAIYLIQDNSAVIRHHKGLPADYVSETRCKDLSNETVKKVMAGRDVSDIGKLSDSADRLLKRHGLCHSYATPLCSGKEILGLLNVVTRRKQTPNPERIRTLSVLALEAESAFTRFKAEKERQRLIPAIEQAFEHIVITDAEGTIQYVNPAFERVTGYSYDEAVGKNPRILKSGKHDEAFYRDLWDHITHGRTWIGRIVNKRKDDTLFTEEATISPVRNHSGNIVSYVGVKRDITREIELEDRLRQSQKMEAVGQLAGGMAHDFNNLLQVIIGYTSLLLSDLSSKSQFHSDIEQVHGAAQRAAKLTSQLLTFSRRQLLEPVHINLNDVVENLMKMLRGMLGANIELKIVPCRDLWIINADQGQLEQILINICVNARDAMPGGGVLTIGTANISIDKHYCKTHSWAKPGRYVLLRIADTGTGIDKRTMERMYDPFFTTKEVGRGTGMGLATVYGIVSQHQGLIHAISKPDQGTEFQVYLPVEKRSTAAGNDNRQSAPATGGTETVLVAEDEDPVRMLTVKLLQRAGYKVLTACNGKEALQLIDENPRDIDLAILDVVMPVMGGREVYDVIREQYPHIRTLFVSGYSPGNVHTNFILDQELELIKKPYTPDLLLRKIKRVLGAPQG